MYRRCLLMIAAIGLVLAGCDDASSPQGAASTVAIRAFIDADGSGAFNAGDVPLSGLGVTLQPTTSTAATYSATTDAQGIATFDDVAPGSYAAALGGSAPAGAVLSTAANPIVVAPFDGGNVTAEFRFVNMPGSLTGVLYRDNNANSQYDAGIDTPAPGLPVALFTATGTSAVATTTTSAAGAFSFTGLRPGPYRVIVTPLPTMTLVGGDTIAVVVPAQAAATLPVRFTGNLISTIAEVRTQPEDATVAFEGVVTVSPMILSTSATGQQVYVQDASGAGILVFYGSTPTGGIVQGDSVRVVGTIDVFSGELQVVRPQVARVGSATVPTPRVITAPQLVSTTMTSGLQGQLVTVQRVTVRAVSGTATAPSYNVTVTAGDTAFVVRISSANVGIAQTFWQVGSTYDVTGLVSAFNGVAQLKPRSAADVKAASLATPIAVARTRPANDTVTIEGVVTAAPGPLGATTMYVQDATGGIMVFNTPNPTTLVLGDSVRLTARVSAFGAEPQLDRFSSSSLIQLVELGTGTVPAPIVISGAQLAGRAYEGRLVRVPGVRVDSVSGTATSTSYNVHVTTTDGMYMQVRVASVTGVGIPRTFWTVGSRYDVVGPLGWFNGVAQVKPRSAADVTAGTALTSIAQARAETAGDTVLVQGVVTVAPGTFRTAGDNLFIQDASGGIQVFNVPAGSTLPLGTVISVYGVMGANGGELQIVRFNTTSPPVITVLGSAALPAPRVLTAAEFSAGTYEGQLARINDVEVVSVGTVSGTTGSYNVTVRFGDGTSGVVRIQSSAVGIPASFWVVGARYDATGVLGSFNGARQIYPRSPADAVRR